MACTYQGNEVCEPEGSTDGQEACYTGLFTTDDFGQADGIGCEHGCVPCRDNPNEHLAFGPTFLTGQNLWGARRFLWPHIGSPDERVTATNRLAILETAHPLWVKPGAQFVLGCCYNNGGQECFGAWSTCSCLDEAEWNVTEGTGTICPDGTPIYNWLPGFFMDRFFFSGYGWPPFAHSTGIKGSYCRKFVPWDPCSVVVRPIPSGGLNSPANIVPRSCRSAGRTDVVYGCSPNPFLFLAGNASPTSECLDGFASDTSENDNQYAFYIPLGEECHDITRYISVQPKVGDIPRVENTNFPLADSKLDEIRNTVLSLIWSTTWPDPDGDMNFDVLDHWASSAEDSGVNLSIGIFSREYNPTNPATNYISVYEFPNSRSRWGDLTIDASLIVTRIDILLVYAPVNAHHRILSQSQATHEIHSYPFMSILIDVTLGIRINSTGGANWIVRTWLDPPEYNFITLTEGAPGTFPTLTPGGNRVVYIDANDEKIRPPSHVHWRGLLAHQTIPSSGDQWAQVSVEASTCEKADVLVAALSNKEMGGHPTLLETNPADPNQLWAGVLEVTF